MLTFLDVLVSVFVEMSVVSLLAMCLMFLVRNPIFQKVCFYIVAIFGIYVAAVALRINNFVLPAQTIIAALVGVSSIAALALERINNGNEKKFLIVRIITAITLVIGMLNVFVF